MAKNECGRLNLYLPKNLIAWLNKQAENNHRSLNNYVTVVLEDHKKIKETPQCTSAH